MRGNEISDRRDQNLATIFCRSYVFHDISTSLFWLIRSLRVDVEAMTNALDFLNIFSRSSHPSKGASSASLDVLLSDMLRSPWIQRNVARQLLLWVPLVTQAGL